MISTKHGKKGLWIIFNLFICARDIGKNVPIMIRLIKVIIVIVKSERRYSIQIGYNTRRSTFMIWFIHHAKQNRHLTHYGIYCFNRKNIFYHFAFFFGETTLDKKVRHYKIYNYPTLPKYSTESLDLLKNVFDSNITDSLLDEMRV